MNKTNPEISIILAVYNAEKWLRECLDSIINQTFTNFEVICVDDCSTDSSVKILQEYATKDPRIKIITLNKNSGVGATSNKALETARGNYIRICDSDDFFDTTNLEYMYNAIKKHNTDSCYINFYYVNEKSEIIGMDKSPQYLYPYDEVFDTQIFLEKFAPMQWALLLKRDVIKDVLMVENTDHQDSQWLYEILYRIKNTVHVKDTFAYYRQLNKSSVRGKTDRVFNYPNLYKKLTELQTKYQNDKSPKSKAFQRRCQIEMENILPKIFFERMPLDASLIKILILYFQIMQYIPTKLKLKYGKKVLKYILKRVFKFPIDFMLSLSKRC